MSVIVRGVGGGVALAKGREKAFPEFLQPGEAE